MGQFPAQLDTVCTTLYHPICAAADANILINQCRLAAQRYLALYGEPMPCEQLVKLLCDLKQAYTQSGGKRPFGVSLIYAGWCASYLVVIC